MEGYILWDGLGQWDLYWVDYDFLFPVFDSGICLNIVCSTTFAYVLVFSPSSMDISFYFIYITKYPTELLFKLSLQIFQFFLVLFLVSYYKIIKFHEKFYHSGGISALKPNLCIWYKYVSLLDVDFEKYLLNYPSRISAIKQLLGHKSVFLTTCLNCVFYW